MLPDITTQKVAVPAALFLALSPGMVLTTDGSKVKFMNRQTDQMSVFFHALVFFLAYSMVAKAMGHVLTKSDLIVKTAMIIALSPGHLLTIPAGSGGVFQSGQTSVESAMIHTVVYAVIFALLRRQFPQFY